MRTLLYTLLLFFSALAQSQDTLVVMNLSHTWMAMEKDGSMEPYVHSSHPNVISFLVPDLEYDQFIKISSSEPIDMWLNNHLIMNQFDSVKVFSELELSSGDHIALYSKNGISNSTKAELIEFSDLETPASQVISVLHKNINAQNDYYLIVLTLLLLLAGVFRKYFPIAFFQSTKNPLSRKVRSTSMDETYSGFGSLDNLFSIFFLSGITTYLISFIAVDFYMVEGGTIIRELFNWLFISLIFSGLFVIKYFWTKLISIMYQFRDLANIQTQDLIHFLTFLAILGVFFTILDISLINFSSEFIVETLKYIFIFGILFFQIWLFFKIDKISGLRKLMIFTYLCTTEFLPGFLVIYWLINK